MDKKVDWQNIHQTISVPHELDHILNRAIDKGTRVIRKRKMIRRTLISIFILLIVFTITVNISPAFAEQIEQLPGGLQLIQAISWNRAMTITYITEEISEPILYQYHESQRIVHVTIIPYPVSRIDLIATARVLWVDASVLSDQNIRSALITRYQAGIMTVIIGYDQPTQTLADYFGLVEKKTNHHIDSKLAGYLVQKIAHHEVVHSIQYDNDTDSIPIDSLVQVSRKDFTDLFSN